MSVNEQVFDVPRARVWQVLADPYAYGEWVVGSREIRGAEGGWPQPGSTFHHTQGFGPVALVKDTTTVLECEKGRRLKLEVRIRPWLIGHVELILEDVAAGTRVRMIEQTKGGVMHPLKPALDRAYKLRNVESLRRLKAESARRASRVRS
jgi:uncharacterized protein YndB with AHSA1/START domain